MFNTSCNWFYYFNVLNNYYKYNVHDAPFQWMQRIITYPVPGQQIKKQQLIVCHKHIVNPRLVQLIPYHVLRCIAWGTTPVQLFVRR